MLIFNLLVRYLRTVSSWVWTILDHRRADWTFLEFVRKVCGLGDPLDILGGMFIRICHVIWLIHLHERIETWVNMIISLVLFVIIPRPLVSFAHVRLWWLSLMEVAFSERLIDDRSRNVFNLSDERRSARRYLLWLQHQILSVTNPFRIWSSVFGSLYCGLYHMLIQRTKPIGLIISEFLYNFISRFVSWWHYALFGEGRIWFAEHAILFCSQSTFWYHVLEFRLLYKRGKVREMVWTNGTFVKMNLYVTYIVVVSLLIIVTNHRSCVNKLLGHNQIIPCDLLPLLLAFLSIERANLMVDSRQFDIAWWFGSHSVSGILRPNISGWSTFTIFPDTLLKLAAHELLSLANFGDSFS